MPRLERARSEGYEPLDRDSGGAVLLPGEPLVLTGRGAEQHKPMVFHGHRFEDALDTARR